MSRVSENYLANAESDAKETVDNFKEEIVEQLCDNGKASDDLLNDYPNGDAWHHESHVDKWYNLHDAAAVLDQLDEFEETDNGLWEGQDMKEALSTCAAFTYGNAVYNEWRELIERINEEADRIISEFDEEEAELEEAVDAANTEAADREQEAEEAGLTDDEVAELAELADIARGEAEEKQAELDGLPERKQAALLAMVEGFTR